jgi:hypothetical protein
MIFCKDCKYIRKPSGALYEPHSDSICLSKHTTQWDYVVGERKAGKCKEVNFDGQCLWFEKC